VKVYACIHWLKYWELPIFLPPYRAILYIQFQNVEQCYTLHNKPLLHITDQNCGPVRYASQYISKQMWWLYTRLTLLLPTNQLNKWGRQSLSTTLQQQIVQNYCKHLMPYFSSVLTNMWHHNDQAILNNNMWSNRNTIKKLWLLYGKANPTTEVQTLFLFPILISTYSY
jgi:hypothetical protein